MQNFKNKKLTMASICLSVAILASTVYAYQEGKDHSRSIIKNITPPFCSAPTYDNPSFTASVTTDHPFRYEWEINKETIQQYIDGIRFWLEIQPKESTLITEAKLTTEESAGKQSQNGHTYIRIYEKNKPHIAEVSGLFSDQKFTTTIPIDISDCYRSIITSDYIWEKIGTKVSTSNIVLYRSLFSFYTNDKNKKASGKVGVSLTYNNGINRLHIQKNYSDTKLAFSLKNTPLKNVTTREGRKKSINNKILYLNTRLIAEITDKELEQLSRSKHLGGSNGLNIEVKDNKASHLLHIPKEYFNTLIMAKADAKRELTLSAIADRTLRGIKKILNLG